MYRTERTLILADTNTHTDGECFQFVDNFCVKILYSDPS